MASSLGTVIFWTSIIFGLLQYCDAAQVIKVGGEAGWTQFDIFTGKLVDFADWSSRLKLAPGDSLVFLFFPQLHDVRLFSTKDDFTFCNFNSSTVLDNGMTGLYTWIAPAPGTYYFGCSDDNGSHCQLGQKFAVTVGEHDAKSPSGSPKAATVGDYCDNSLEEICSEAGFEAPGVAPMPDTPIPSPAEEAGIVDAAAVPFKAHVPDFGFRMRPQPPISACVRSATSVLIYTCWIGMLLLLLLNN